MITQDQALDQVVYSLVVKGNYPTPTPFVDDQINAKNNQIADLKNGITARPATKAEYAALIASIQIEIATLEQQNVTISAANQAANKVVDDKYISDITAAKLDSNNIWTAVRTVRGALIDDIQFRVDRYNMQTAMIANGTITATKDTPAQFASVLTYIQALRDITKQSDPTAIIWPVVPE